MKRTMWGLLATGLMLVACDSGGSEATDPDKTVAETTEADESDDTSDDDKTDDTSDDDTTDDTSDDDKEPGDEPTDTTTAESKPKKKSEKKKPADPCAEFEALLGYDRMMEVKRGDAPTDPGCKAAVDRSTVALNTYEVSLKFSAQYTDADSTEMFQSEYCNRTGTMTNIFEVPVIYWGITRIQDGDTVLSYEPFATEPIPPGGTAPFEYAGITERDRGKSCTVSFSAIVAPTGGLAAGIDGAPAPGGDPLASDDALVWGLALLELDTPGMRIADFVNWSEDIHSPDVGLHIKQLATGWFEGAETTHSVCNVAPVNFGDSVVGEYVWLMFTSQSKSGSGHYVGLFSRGTDRRWRFLGLVKEIDTVVDPNDPCKMPPRSVG